MARSPYRISSAPPDDVETKAIVNHDAELILPFAALWVASIVQVGGSFFRHEPLGPSLPMLAILLLPYLLRDALLGYRPSKGPIKKASSAVVTIADAGGLRNVSPAPSGRAVPDQRGNQPHPGQTSRRTRRVRATSTEAPLPASARQLTP